MSPLFHKIGGVIKYIKFEILQIVSPSEDVKFSNVRGPYLRKYGKLEQLEFKLEKIIGIEKHAEKVRKIYW